MSAVVLVHGSWHGAWCWDQVVDELTREGVSSVAVELPFTSYDDDVAAARTAIESAGEDRSSVDTPTGAWSSPRRRRGSRVSAGWCTWRHSKRTKEKSSSRCLRGTRRSSWNPWSCHPRVSSSIQHRCMRSSTVTATRRWLPPWPLGCGPCRVRGPGSWPGDRRGKTSPRPTSSAPTTRPPLPTSSEDWPSDRTRSSSGIPTIPPFSPGRRNWPTGSPPTSDEESESGLAQRETQASGRVVSFTTELGSLPATMSAKVTTSRTERRLDRTATQTSCSWAAAPS